MSAVCFHQLPCPLSSNFQKIPGHSFMCNEFYSGSDICALFNQVEKFLVPVNFIFITSEGSMTSFFMFSLYGSDFWNCFLELFSLLFPFRSFATFSSAFPFLFFNLFFCFKSFLLSHLFSGFLSNVFIQPHLLCGVPAFRFRGQPRNTGGRGQCGSSVVTFLLSITALFLPKVSNADFRSPVPMLILIFNP